jgi:hypothetical protein
LDGFVLDAFDTAQVAELEALGVAVRVTAVEMNGASGRRRLAEDVLAFGDTLPRRVRIV